MSAERKSRSLTPTAPPRALPGTMPLQEAFARGSVAAVSHGLDPTQEIAVQDWGRAALKRATQC